MNVLSVASNIVRILRNMCTNNHRNQDTVLNHGVHIIVHTNECFEIDLLALSRQASLGSRNNGMVRILRAVPSGFSPASL